MHVDELFPDRSLVCWCFFFFIEGVDSQFGHRWTTVKGPLVWYYSFVLKYIMKMRLHLFIIPAQFEAPSQYPLFPLIDHVRRDCCRVPVITSLHSARLQIMFQSMWVYLLVITSFNFFSCPVSIYDCFMHDYYCMPRISYPHYYVMSYYIGNK